MVEDNYGHPIPGIPNLKDMPEWYVIQGKQVGNKYQQGFVVLREDKKKRLKLSSINDAARFLKVSKDELIEIIMLYPEIALGYGKVTYILDDHLFYLLPIFFESYKSGSRVRWDLLDRMDSVEILTSFKSASNL